MVAGGQGVGSFHAHQYFWRQLLTVIDKITHQFGQHGDHFIEQGRHGFTGRNGAGNDTVEHVFH